MKNSFYKHPISIVLFLFFIFSAWRFTPQKVNTAAIPTDRLENNWWKERHEKILNKLNSNPQLILIGNSIFNTLDYPDRKNVWEKHLDKYNTINMGFSGDRTENVIWRLQNGELEKINPKVALLLIGTNNTDGNHFPTINYPEELEEAIWKICKIIREKLPKTEILLLGILPYGSNIPNLRNTINQKTNKLISKFPSKDEHIHYVDIGKLYLSDNNKVNKNLMPDYLHPNAEGHMLMFDTLDTEISKLIK